MTDFIVPRCRHGAVILGCTHDDCPEQTAYLEDQRRLLDQYYAAQQREARKFVRGQLGLPTEP